MPEFEDDGKLAQFKIRGLNLNHNLDLSDQSMKRVIQLCIDLKEIKVLSVERLNLTPKSIMHLFENLHSTNLGELNISGIPLNYHCID